MHAQQPRYHRLRRLFIATALGVMSAMSLVPETAHAQQCNSNDSTAPCFAQNTDILSGQRHLLRNDDLLVNIPIVTSDTEVFNFLLDTANGAVVNQTPDLVVTADCAMALPVSGLILGRSG